MPSAPPSIDWFPLWLSLRVAALATLFVLTLGTAIAYLLSHKNFRGKEAADSLITLPLVLPPTVLGYYLLVLLGRNSGLGHIYESVFGQPLVFTWQAAVVAAILHSAPIYIKGARTVLESVDYRYEWVAHSLGASEFRTFLRITLPLAWRGLSSLASLCFARSLGDFGVTMMVAGNIPGRTQTLSVAIFDAVESGNGQMARTLVVIISATALVLLWAAARLSRPQCPRQPQRMMSAPMKIDARLLKRLPAVGETEAFELNIHLKSDAATTVLWGASGAGKTLALNCLGGFSTPNQGRILVNDELYFDGATRVNLPPRSRRCGYMFQDHALFPHMTVRENLKFAAAVARTSSRLDKHRRMNDLLEAFELSDLSARKPAQLSGGEKQRAALARMLVGDPHLLLLDEPTRGLDARLRQTFYEVLRTTRARSQAPIVLVTHDLDECMQLGDYVCLMESGRFVQSGPREQVFSRPANLEVARALGIYNLLPAKVTALDPSRDTCSLEVAGCEVQGRYIKGRLIGDQGHLCVRQTEARLLPNIGGKGPNQILLRALGVTPSAQGTKVLLEHGAAAVVSETEYAHLRGEDILKLEIPPSAVYFIAR